jgi:branched-chain amino acid transport system substrate-binding protein
MKRFLLSCTAIIALGATNARADITIGLAGPFTGSTAYFGEQMKHGAEQAVIDINAAGGFNGEKIVLQEADDVCDPKQAVAVANQMISRGVKFVVGHACSGSSIPASKTYNEEQVLMISPISSNPALTDAGFPDIFRVAGRDEQQGAVIADYMLKHLKDKKIAITHDNSAWGLGIAQELKKNLNAAGVHEVMFEAFAPDGRDYSALVSRLKQNGVQAAFFGGYHTSVGLILRQMKEQNVKLQAFGGDALVTDQLWSITGPAAEGLLMSFSPDARKKPEAQAVVTALRKSGYEPEGYTLNTYAAVQVVADAIRQTGKDPVRVAQYMHANKFKNVIGDVTFNAKGDVGGQAFVLYQWHDGKYAELGN